MKDVYCSLGIFRTKFISFSKHEFISLRVRNKFKLYVPQCIVHVMRILGPDRICGDTRAIRHGFSFRVARCAAGAFSRTIRAGPFRAVIAASCIFQEKLNATRGQCFVIFSKNKMYHKKYHTSCVWIVAIGDFRPARET